MSNKDLIPKEISRRVPKKCPVCNRSCLAVFRTWKPTGRVSCEFLHSTGTKICRKTYSFNLK